MARYINDCRNPCGYNVEFLKSPQEKCAWVIAQRDIAVGEELFVDYGRWYWLLKPSSSLSRAELKSRTVALKEDRLDLIE